MQFLTWLAKKSFYPHICLVLNQHQANIGCILFEQSPLNIPMYCWLSPHQIIESENYLWFYQIVG